MSDQEGHEEQGATEAHVEASHHGSSPLPRIYFPVTIFWHLLFAIFYFQLISFPPFVLQFIFAYGIVTIIAGLICIAGERMTKHVASAVEILVIVSLLLPGFYIFLSMVQMVRK